LWGTSACEATAVASSYCGFAAAVVTRDGSPTAVALAAGHDTLSERRPVIADVLNLSGLTSVRAGTVDDPLSIKESGRVSDCPSKSKACEEKCYSPQVGECPFPHP
jgi:hypothetical protein